jgi:hypothetical protein
LGVLGGSLYTLFCKVPVPFSSAFAEQQRWAYQNIVRILVDCKVGIPNIMRLLIFVCFMSFVLPALQPMSGDTLMIDDHC